MKEKEMWKPPRFAFVEGLISFAIVNLNYARVVIPITFQFPLLIFLCQQQMDLGERVGHCKPNRVVTSISTAASDVISLLEQINTSWHLIFRYWFGECVFFFFLCLLVSTPETVCIHLADPITQCHSLTSELYQLCHNLATGAFISSLFHISCVSIILVMPWGLHWWAEVITSLNTLIRGTWVAQ